MWPEFTRSEISKAGLRSRTFPTTTSESSELISSKREAPAPTAALFRILSSSIRSLGRVGLSESEAREQNRNIRVAKMPMNRVARAQEVDESRGFMKAIVDADTGQILGAAVLGLEGGEVMSMIQLAMMGKLSYQVLHNDFLLTPIFPKRSTISLLNPTFSPDSTAVGESAAVENHRIVRQPVGLRLTLLFVLFVEGIEGYAFAVQRHNGRAMFAVPRCTS